jgi:hypothetical protein
MLISLIIISHHFTILKSTMLAFSIISEAAITQPKVMDDTFQAPPATMITRLLTNAIVFIHW